MTTKLSQQFRRITDSIRLTYHAKGALLSGRLTGPAKRLADAVQAVGNQSRTPPGADARSRAIGALADLIRAEDDIQGGATHPDQWDGAELGPVTLSVDGRDIAVIDTFADHVRNATGSRDLAISVADMLK